MGQLVSDITEILDYKDAKKSTEKQRQEILAQMAADKTEKTNLVKKHWLHSVQNMVHLDGHLMA